MFVTLVTCCSLLDKMAVGFTLSFPRCLLTRRFPTVLSCHLLTSRSSTRVTLSTPLTRAGRAPPFSAALELPGLPKSYSSQTEEGSASEACSSRKLSWGRALESFLETVFLARYGGAGQDNLKLLLRLCGKRRQVNHIRPVSATW